MKLAIALLLASTAPVVTELAGKGRIRRARATVEAAAVAIELTTAAGTRRHAVEELAQPGTDVTITALRWRDVVGDADPELWIELATDRAPCGACDDSPRFVDHYVIVCRPMVKLAPCSPAIHHGHSDNITPSEWHAEVVVSRDGTYVLRGLRGPRRLVFR